MKLSFLTKSPYIPPSFPEAQTAFVGEVGEKAYEKMLQRWTGESADIAVSNISYASDGLKVTGIEVLPEFAAGEKGPLIIYNRGGNREFGALSVPQILNLMAPLVRSLRAGVLASNYRGNGGGEGQEEFGGADVNDVLKLIEIGKTQPWWDGKNMFMFGWSRGGMMTYLAIKHGAQLNAAAVGAGLADLYEAAEARAEMEKHVYSQLMPEYETRKDEHFRERSAVCWPEKITTPLLLLHGDADKRVDISHARDLHEKLVKLGREVKLVEYPNGGHGLISELDDVMAHVSQWFTAHRF